MDEQTERTKRNLNPTPEARVAMTVWGKEYSEQSGGSMDFWDSLSADRQRMCERIVADLKKLKRRTVTTTTTEVSLEVAPRNARITVDLEEEVDGRWLAEVVNHPGAMAYGVSPLEAIKNALWILLTQTPDRLTEVALPLYDDILGDYARED